MTYRELQEAAAFFGLGERATLSQIKARHRKLARDYHPDRGAQADARMMQRLNQAYRILTDYCGSYRFCFSEAEFLEQVPEERLRRQFGWDPVWGGELEKD